MAFDFSAVLFLYDGAKSHLRAKQGYLVYCHLLFLRFVLEIAHACICFAIHNFYRFVVQRYERRGYVLSLMVFVTFLFANLRQTCISNLRLKFSRLILINYCMLIRRRRGCKAFFIFPNRNFIFSDLGDVSRDCRSEYALIHAVANRGLSLMLYQF